MENKIRLKVLGLTYSQTQTGSYALVLAEEAGDRRIPIMIGAFEAQSIALHLEDLSPPRPLTHDLFLNFSKAFHITLKEVVISKLSEGVFYSILYFFDGNDIVMIDSRTSDAIALALRFKCPIYTTPDIIESAGILMDDQDQDAAKDPEEEADDFLDTVSYQESSLEELNDLLQEAVDAEDYEKAAEIQSVINKKKKFPEP